MSIQMRRGANADFDKSKMLPGEFAVTTDGTRKVYAAFAAGDVKELASKEDVQNIVDDFNSTSDKKIEEAKNEIIAETNEQVQKIINEGNRIFESLPDDYEEASRNAREAVRSKGDAIVCKKSGKSIVATDSSGNYVRGLTPFGKTKQRTTTGAQLLDLRTDKTENYLGLKLELKDENVNISGTVTGATCTLWLLGQYANTETLFTLQPGTYTLSYGVIWNYDGTNRKGLKDTFILAEPFNVTGVSTQTYDIGVTVNLTTNVMLNAGSEALPWEPYTGGLPSPSMEYPQELENVGMMGNLCNLPDMEEKETNGIIWSCKKGAVIVKGTATDISSSMLVGLHYDFAGEVGPFFVSGTSNKITVYVRIIKADDSESFIRDTSFILDGTEKRVTVYMQINKDVTVDTIVYPMLNYGTTALPYHPYSGQMEIESAVLGKNLLNVTQENSVTSAGYSNYSILNDVINITGPVLVGFKMPVKHGITYNFSFNKNVNDNVFHLRVREYSGEPTTFNSDDKHHLVVINKNCSSETHVSETYTPSSENVKWIAVGFYTESENVITKLQGEVGESETEYEMYKPKQPHINLLGSNGLPGIPLGQTIPDVIANSPIHMSGVYWDEETEQYWIGDTVENESGERTVRVYEDVINDSSQVKRSLYYLWYAELSKKALYNVGFLNTHYLNLRNTTNLGGNAYINTSDNLIVMYDDRELDVIKEMVTSSPVKVQYILAEPYTVPLTTGEIESYEALRSNHHVTTVMNDCDAHMEFSYNADTQEHIKQNYVPVTSYTALEERVAAIEEQILSQEV